MSSRVRGAAQRGPRRILVHDYSGHPFQVQLSRELARRGHRVLHVHCSSFVTGKGALARQPDDPQGFEARAISLGEVFEKYSYRKRLRQEARYGRLAAGLVQSWAPDVVISSNTPLYAQRRFLRRVRQLGVSFVFWQQDIYSVAMGHEARRRVPVLGRLLARGFADLERRMLARSDAVVVISEDFVPHLERWGLDASLVHVVENWAPLDELPPRPRDNPWARRHGLVDRTVLLYSGTLGLKHNPALLLRLAERYRGRPDVAVVVVSEGRGADWLRERSSERGLDDTLLLLPFQPYAELPDALASADVLLSILEAEAGVFSVPSKVLTYHCAGRAIVAAVPPGNLAARILVREGSGVVVDPSDEQGFESAVAELVDDPAARARMAQAARAYAERAFDIARITDRFERILDDVEARRSGAAPSEIDLRTPASAPSGPRPRATTGRLERVTFDETMD